MVAYTKPQQRKKEGERLRREGDKIKFTDLRFERWQAVRFRKARRQDVPCCRMRWSLGAALVAAVEQLVNLLSGLFSHLSGVSVEFSPPPCPVFYFLLPF